MRDIPRKPGLQGELLAEVAVVLGWLGMFGTPLFILFLLVIWATGMAYDT